MIQVSNEFKKAIKNQERKIKGYVEVLYDLPNIEITTTTNITSTYTEVEQITNGVRVENLYGSVDYLTLDSSYITMDDAINNNIGFISDDLFEDLQSPYFTLSFSETTIKGITLYFRTNIPTNLTLSYSDGTSDTITDNENETIQLIFDTPKIISSVTININNVMYPDRKIYLMEADLGITQVYKDQDLIEFTVDEEVDKLVEEVPINETSITLNNMSDLFNPLNPSGIVPYLSESTIIKPYIGVLTETQGVEYVKMGEFYFDSYTNNSDATTTLIGKNIIKKINEEILKDDNGVNIFTSALSKEQVIQFLENYNIEVESIIGSYGNYNKPFWSTDSDKLIDFLSTYTFSLTDIIYANRSNKLNIIPINQNIKDTLNKTELIKDVNYKKIEKINTIELIRNYAQVNSEVSNRTILTATVTLSKSSEVFLIKGDNPSLIDASISRSGGTGMTVISQGYHFLIIRVTGNVGNSVTITAKSTYDRSLVKQYYYLSNKKENEKEVKLSFEGPQNGLPTTYLDYSNILNITPSYEMSFEYNGDPSLEAGDYINVETPYGYKKLFIQKNRFKFDGGLEGSIEGVE